MKGLIKVFVFSLLLSGSLNAQDFQFNQFAASPLTLNPAMTGMMNGCSRGAVNFKQTAASFLNVSSVALAFDKPLIKEKLGNDYIGIGLIVNADRLSHFNAVNSSIFGSFAYHKALDRNARYVLSAGLQAGLVRTNREFSNLIFQSLLSGVPSTLPITSDDHSTLFDLHGGGLLSASPTNKLSFYLAASFFHLTEPGETPLNGATNFIDLRTSLHAGADIKLSNSISLASSALYMSQAAAEQILVGGNIGYHFRTDKRDSNAVLLGLSYQLGDAMIPFVGLEYGDYKFGLSHSITISELAEASSFNDGIEVSFVYEAFCGGLAAKDQAKVYTPRF